MSEDPYKSPESNVIVASKAIAALPNPVIVAVLIVVISAIIGTMMDAIEYFFDFTLSANPSLSTIIPAIIIGNYYGKKRQDFFPRIFRVKVVIIWMVIGLLLSVVVFTSVEPDLLQLVTGNSTFTAIFVGKLLLSCVFCYFAIYFGERIAIKLLAKKS